MDDSMAVKERDSFINIWQDGENLIFLEVLSFLHKFEELPIQAIFHDQVNALLIVEKPVELHDVGVIKIELDLDLS